jgi:TonB family protein
LLQSLILLLAGTSALFPQYSYSENGYDKPFYGPLVDLEPPVLLGGVEGILAEFVYPEAARLNRIEGVVVIECLVDMDGYAKDARAVLGPKLLMRAAEDAVEKSQWRPARIHGHPVQTRVQFDLDIRIDGPAEKPKKDYDSLSRNCLKDILLGVGLYGVLVFLQSLG